MWVTDVGIQVLGRLLLFFAADRWSPRFSAGIVFLMEAGRRGQAEGETAGESHVCVSSLSLCSRPRIFKQLFWKLHALTSASII